MTEAQTWLLAYLIAGMAHYLRLVRAATRIEGELGVILRAGTRRPKLGTFIGVIMAWPVAVYNGLREGRGRSWVEVTTFVAAGVLLGIPSFATP